MLWITMLGLEKNRGEKWRRGGDPHLRPCRRPKLRRQTSPQVLPHLPPPPPPFSPPLSPPPFSSSLPLPPRLRPSQIQKTTMAESSSSRAWAPKVHNALEAGSPGRLLHALGSSGAAPSRA